ncbi:WapI family immunity protein [Flavobacterium pectinovorum]|uniref:Uncharacterized protein n=1 Tax=Flavobacterium pectinovorum TaxID=29533 RepID=A0AB36P3S9_9FLAO|nr:hypothetical protein [Flavobacterium pectinovorum]OXB06440.1 hypothetical protein B0A72_05175 [Flavobacterium pectinovorum]SHL89310.1 hypothetical protein SAMN05444387_1373 [Flavobacterium pectinovorum]
MEIKDKEGNERIKLSNFKKLFREDPIFINVSVEINMNIANAKEEIIIELTDFDEFLKNLKKLNETLKYTFYFQHNDEQMQIKFEAENSGNINVTGFLKDNQYLNSLNFSFEMPSTEILVLIKQGKNIMKRICSGEQ